MSNSKIIPSSLITVASIDYTIYLTLKQVDNEKDIETKISRKDIKKLLLLCNKNVLFTFGNNIYQQKDNIAMGSLLDPVLAEIFMVYL